MFLATSLPGAESSVALYQSKSSEFSENFEVCQKYIPKLARSDSNSAQQPTHLK